MATKTKKKTSTKTPTALAQAQSEMDVKYKPQLDVAQGLLGDAADQYKSDIETAKGNQNAIQAFAKEQEAPTLDRYKTALTTVAGNEANTASALTGTGPAADIFKRAITGTQGTQRTNIAGAGTRATQELSDRQTAAQAGGIAAQTKARDDYRKTKSSLTSQIQSLVGQQGADVINRFGELAEAEAGRQNKIDVAKIGADARRDVAGAGAANAADKANKAAAAAEVKRKEGIHEATGNLKTDVADAIDQWKNLASRVDVQYVMNGDNKTKVAKPYLNKDGNPVSQPEHAAVASRTTLTPQQIKDQLTNTNKIDPGIVHIALLVRAGKVLDATAIKYIKDHPKMRVPREWMPDPNRYGGVGRGADTT